MSVRDTEVLIAGDGPAGLSAALLLAKNGVQVDVFGRDQTPTHKALLRNYLGVADMPGPQFMQIARRQTASAGARLHDMDIVAVDGDTPPYVAKAGDGSMWRADHLVLANGKDPGLAEGLGLAAIDRQVTVDRTGHTSLPQVYAVGWLARGTKIQAAIAVGDGAAVALEILSARAGKAVHDFDVLPPREVVHAGDW